MAVIVCRRLKKSEANIASELEKRCLETAWSERQIAEALDNENAVYIGAFIENTLCGIGSAYCVCGDAEIMNVAVCPEFRRKGVGKAIMAALEAALAAKNSEAITLEVAEDNLGAIALYESAGFCAVGTRKGFYRGKNAIIMRSANALG